jgi:hypothetical protein
MGGNLLGPRHPGFGTTNPHTPLCCLLHVSAMSTQRFPPVSTLHWCGVEHVAADMPRPTRPQVAICK